MGFKDSKQVALLSLKAKYLCQILTALNFDRMAIKGKGGYLHQGKI